MKLKHLYGYETCVYSKKRKQAPWRVSSGCQNDVRLFTGRHYELPNTSVCMTCPFYIKEEKKDNGSTPEGI